MSVLAELFVGRPLNIFAVAFVFSATYAVLRLSSFGALRRTRMLLIAAITWLAYAAWEWLVQVRTPEADIRADLLVIWPLLAVVSLVALYGVFRRTRERSP